MWWYQINSSWIYANYITDYSLTYSQSTLITLATSLILQRIDYCNSVLAVLPASSIRPLQRVQKYCSSSGSQSGSSSTHHSSTATATLATSTLQNTVHDRYIDAPHIQQHCSNLPLWLNQFFIYTVRSLRSTTNGAAAVQRTRTRLGDRAFSIAGPRVWNYLPASLYDKLFPLLLPKDSWRLLCIFVCLIANFRLLLVLFSCIILL